MRVKLSLGLFCMMMGWPAIADDSLINVGFFDKTVADLSFADRVELKDAGYRAIQPALEDAQSYAVIDDSCAVGETSFDEQGICTSECIYPGITIEEDARLTAQASQELERALANYQIARNSKSDMNLHNPASVSKNTAYTKYETVNGGAPSRFIEPVKSANSADAEVLSNATNTTFSDDNPIKIKLGQGGEEILIPRPSGKDGASQQPGNVKMPDGGSIVDGEIGDVQLPELPKKALMPDKPDLDLPDVEFYEETGRVFGPVMDMADDFFVTSDFGSRRVTTGSKKHRGLDFRVVGGKTPILATADGVVAFAGTSGGYGKMVKIKHDFGANAPEVYTLYAHLHEINVESGKPVKQGQKIGLGGNTGNSSGAHLHYEVRVITKNGEIRIDPLASSYTKGLPEEFKENIAVAEQFKPRINRAKYNYIGGPYRFDVTITSGRLQDCCPIGRSYTSCGPGRGGCEILFRDFPECQGWGR